jgi:hypothetical protein
MSFPAINRYIDIASGGLVRESWTDVEAKSYMSRHFCHDKRQAKVLAFAEEVQLKHEDPNYDGSSFDKPTYS